MLFRVLKWMAGLFLALVGLAALFISVAGWNWLRGPIERMAEEKTGRALHIRGDLTIQPAWPSVHVQAREVAFANPAWTRERQMVVANEVAIAIDLPRLLRRHLVLPEVRLAQPVVFLEQAPDGRKNWLLDLQQRDEGASIRIDRLRLDQGRLGYDDEGQKTHLRAGFSSLDTGQSGRGVSFAVRGSFKGLPLEASGSGGPVLALRDEHTPYPLDVELRIGHTGVKAAGSVTSLQTFSALDLHLELRGRSLRDLYPLLGMALPETPPYSTSGHLVHSGRSWRYEEFSGRIGRSDLAGTVRIETGGKRPAMEAKLVSRVLDFADLAPLIGARGSSPRPSRAVVPAPGRVLPDIPFTPERWDSVDADVSLKAASIRRPRQLPLENLTTRLTLRDAVLKLDPLDFGVAGGHLAAVISLDGRQEPIRAHARVGVRKLRLSRLFPAFESGKGSFGELNGEFDLSGAGNSVGRMLAGANGRVGLVVSGGRVSRLMMETVGLHLWEVLTLKLTGDKLINLRCGVANFGVRQGVMGADALIVDTEVTTLLVTGNINLATETLDLTLNQKTKITSPVALKSPIHIGGSLARPVVDVSKGPMLARGLGAIGLGIVNPLTALLPLIDPGPGEDSNCAQLVRRTAARRSGS